MCRRGTECWVFHCVVDECCGWVRHYKVTGWRLRWEVVLQWPAYLRVSCCLLCMSLSCVYCRLLTFRSSPVRRMSSTLSAGCCAWEQCDCRNLSIALSSHGNIVTDWVCYSSALRMGKVCRPGPSSFDSVIFVPRVLYLCDTGILQLPLLYSF